MHEPERSVTLPDLDAEQTRSSAFLTQCHRNALDQLKLAYSKKRPLAVMIGEGKATARFVIRKFLTRLDDDVSFVRITGPCTSATEFMGKIISAVGFRPKDMGLSDLESIFAMFLSFQKAHHKRTVICIEEVQECDWWVLDKIRALVEAEREGKFGLIVILSGQAKFGELLALRPLDSVAAYAGKRITLAPFTLPETREYLRHRVEATGRAGIDELLEYHAIPLIHELCAGVPDAIGELFSQCLSQARDEGVELIDKEIVTRAYDTHQSHEDLHVGDDHAETIATEGLFPQPGRLLIRLTDQDIREVRLRRSNILIGRSRLCDIRLDSKIISRHHALIRYTAQGAILIDLGSTNGTKVDGYTVKEHHLVGGETIAVGDCQIEYLRDDPLQSIEDAKLSAEVEFSS